MPKPISVNAKSARWICTIYDYDKYGTPTQWMSILCEKFNITYYVLGEELCPSTGRRHLQGYIEFGHGQSVNDRKKLSTMRGLQKAAGCKRKDVIAWWNTIHWEIPNGTPNEQRLYCTKTRPERTIAGIKYPADIPNLVVHEWGTIMPEANAIGTKARKDESHQGERTDLDFAKDLADAGTVTDYKSAWATRGLSCQASSLLLAHLARTEPASRGQSIVFWLHGATGSDKSRLSKWAKQHFADELGWNTYTCGTTSKWFCGYDDDEVAIIDDHRACHWEFSLLLRLLDRYPVNVEVKNGRTWWRPKVIIITSPVPHDISYQGLPRFDGDIAQLTRRVTQPMGGEFLFQTDVDGPGSEKQRFRDAIASIVLDSKPEIPVPIPVLDRGDSAGSGGSVGAGGSVRLGDGNVVDLSGPGASQDSMHELCGSNGDGTYTAASAPGPQSKEAYENFWDDPDWAIGFM